MEKIVSGTTRFIGYGRLLENFLIGINEEISFKDWVKKYTRKVVRKIFPYMKSVVKANNDLRKMI